MRSLLLLAVVTTLPALAQSNVNVSNLAEAQSEVDISVDPSNPAHLIAGSNSISQVQPALWIYESTNGGATWSHQPSVLPGSSGFCSDPAVGFDRNGNAYFAQLAVTFSGTSSLWVARKTAGAASRSAQVAVPAVNPDKEFLAVDTQPGSACLDSVYLAWDSNESNGTQTIRVARSSNGGASYGAAPKVNDADYLLIGADPQVGPNGILYVAWADFTAKEIRIDKSTDCGSTWGLDHAVHAWQLQLSGGISAYPPSNPSRGVGPFPSLTVDTSSGPFRGRLYVAYNDQPSLSTSGLDVFIRSSDDQGSTWSAPVRVNDDPPGQRHDQYMPRAKVDPSTGSLHVIFYDTRDDATHLKTNVYWATSENGGASFGANVKVTTAQSDETTSSADYNGYGDYLGLAAQGGKVFPAWTDGRLGQEEIFFSQLVSAPTALSITTVGLPDAVTQLAYSSTLGSLGGTSPYHWAVTGLPPGFTVNPATGLLSGTAGINDVASYPLAVTLTDSAGGTATKTLPLRVVLPPLQISTLTLPDAEVRRPYSTLIAAVGGKPPYVFSTPLLPLGLTLAVDGTLSGTPDNLAVGPASLVVSVADAASNVATRTLALQVGPPRLEGVGQLLVAAQETAAYGPVQLLATGGTPAYQWSWAPGFIHPAGLVLGADGQLGGTPAPGSAGGLVLKVAVKEATGSFPSTGSFELSLIIFPPPVAVLDVPPVVDPGVPFTLDPTGSIDPAGHPFTDTPLWSLPPGAVITQTNAPKLTVSLKARGPHEFGLVAYTASAQTAPVTATVTVRNAAPVVTATSSGGSAKQLITLKGSASDANDDPLGGFKWSQLSGPTVAIASSDALVASFTPAQPGSYVFQLEVSDAQTSSAAQVTLEVTHGGGCGCSSGSEFLGGFALLGLLAARRRPRRVSVSPRRQ